MSESLFLKGSDVGPEGAVSLPHGRTVVISDSDTDQQIEVRSPEGEVEVTISITADGPVVKLVGAKLELESTDTVSVRSRVFDVQTTEAARMHTDGELTLTSGLDTRVVSEGDVHVLGKMIWLN